MGERPNPEKVLLLMVVLGIMFIGICIAMNLFSRARFKKRPGNAFAISAASTSGRATPQARMRTYQRTAAPPSRQSQRSMLGPIVDTTTMQGNTHCQSPLANSTNRHQSNHQIAANTTKANQANLSKGSCPTEEFV